MRLFRPELKSFSLNQARQFLKNFLFEIRVIPFTPLEQSQLLDTKIMGRIMNPATHDFFLYHFGSLLVRAVTALFLSPDTDRHKTITNQNSRIIDLGCGSGTSAILFALLGARVVGIDLNPVLLAVCRKRQEFYEKHFGTLSLQFVQADTRTFDYSTFKPIDAIYSLFAFNMMQPTSRLLASILPALASNGRIVISDGNRLSIYNRLFRPRTVYSPHQIEVLLSNYRSNGQSAAEPGDCRLTTVTTFHGFLPPFLVRQRWVNSLGEHCAHLLNTLGIARWLGVSYTISAKYSPVTAAEHPKIKEGVSTR